MNKSILIIAENHVTFQFLEKTLKDEGILIYFAEEFSLAERILKEKNIDLIAVELKIFNNTAYNIAIFKKYNSYVPIIALYEDVKTVDIDESQFYDFLRADLPPNLWKFKISSLLQKIEDTKILNQRFKKATNYIVGHVKEFELNKSVYKTIFNNLAVGVIVIDRGLKVVEINKTAKEWIQYNNHENEYICKDILNLDSVFEKKSENSDFNEGVLEGFQKKIKYNERVIKVTSRPLLSNSKDVQLIVSILEDISEEERDKELLINEINKRKLLEFNPFSFHGLIGKSPQMDKVYNSINIFADSDMTILIEGETGTGKELVAKAIHKLSRRSDKVFIPVHCGAIPENLLESNLFGYVKGAFTGAYKDKEGILQTADEGTVFLDELECASLRMQSALLRVIENKEYTPIGSSYVRKTNVRFICASNINLDEKKETGEFREDLYYRVSESLIKLPPLKERKEDIFLLINEFLMEFEKDHDKDAPIISSKILSILTNYDWPGNVRELKNLIKTLSIRFSGKKLQPHDLPERFNNYLQGNEILNLKENEKRNLEKALVLANGNKTDAAKLLGIARKTIYELIKRHKLKLM